MRASSATSYLDGAFASGRDNLKIYTHSMARRILFDSDVDNHNTSKAVGVQVSSIFGGGRYNLTASRGVISSAGAIQSPQLLMVSGIGPRRLLQKHDITIVAESPGVGQNLWNHSVLPMSWPINLEAFGSLENPMAAASAVEAYHRNQTMQYSSGGTDMLGWEKLSDEYRAKLDRQVVHHLETELPKDWPDVEIEIASALRIPGNNTNYLTIVSALQTTSARGSITIFSADMIQPPVIDLGLMAHHYDRQVIVQAVRPIYQIANNTTLKPIIIGNTLSGSSLYSEATGEEVMDFVKPNIGLDWHAACTCKMGRDNDTMAVLNSRAQVKGVSNLWVVDGSSFPTLPPGHPQSNVYMLAEKIAHDIKANL